MTACRVFEGNLCAITWADCDRMVISVGVNWCLWKGIRDQTEDSEGLSTWRLVVYCLSRSEFQGIFLWLFSCLSTCLSLLNLSSHPATILWTWDTRTTITDASKFSRVNRLSNTCVWEKISVSLVIRSNRPLFSLRCHPVHPPHSTSPRWWRYCVVRSWVLLTPCRSLLHASVIWKQWVVYTTNTGIFLG